MTQGDTSYIAAIEREASGSTKESDLKLNSRLLRILILCRRAREAANDE